ncbi:7-cyano-7-deazaguanine synthase [Klebsiella pneumoniae]|uniref:Qat anti-phage system QueC-like protein QatC n=1 Tax=Klebsiella pneumoniae TaxID=573 RepID=UPI001912B059|nr:Qat anti-phage system QueC-like protein QatC [Klebsiella pneumoniae]MBK5845943.1 7-cyano-7-deazaguanine synthase [Klebsiella pneumoniae]
MKVVCAPEKLLPEVLEEGVEYFSLHTIPANKKIGHIAQDWRIRLKKMGFHPDVVTWDFVTIAMSVCAADLACLRKKTADGWTREIELAITVCNKDNWLPHINKLQDAFRFLTGDFWEIKLNDGGEPPLEPSKLTTSSADCISLLSGGMDSLIGAIDLTENGRSPCFVSQMAKGDSKKQREFSETLNGKVRHYQWNHRIKVPHVTERSTRGRSLIFISYGVLAATILNTKKPVELFIPENGFISLNIPLNEGRFGSLSTKTTHPVFLAIIQDIFDSAGINILIKRPYQGYTKGEMIKNCKNIPLLLNHIGNTTSCGRFGYYNYQHCGRCVPCLVRRAAFLSAGIPDTTINKYYFDDIGNPDSEREKGANDIGAVARACLLFREKGINDVIGGALVFSSKSIEGRKFYSDVVENGFKELDALLTKHGVL